MASPFSSFSERGNVFFILLLGIALFAALSMALVQMSDRQGQDVTPEKAKLVATRILNYAREAKTATQRLYTSGTSEADLRFAHPKLAADYGAISSIPTRQLFAPEGGGVEYTEPPSGASTNATATWEFFGNSEIPQVGTTAADLTMVLPSVNAEVCRQINMLLGYDKTAAIPTDSAGGCVYSSTAADRFAGTFKTGGNINVVGTTGFTILPAPQACVSCGGTYHYYNVLIER